MRDAVENPHLQFGILRSQEAPEHCPFVIISVDKMLVEITLEDKIQFKHSATALPPQLLLAFRAVQISGCQAIQIAFFNIRFLM